MAQSNFVKELCDILVKNQVVKADEAAAMAKAFAESGKARFDTFLLGQGLVSRQNLLNALSEYFHVPAFDCVGYFFERQELHKFPKDFLIRHAIIPVERDQNMYTVVASRPNEPALLSGIGNHVSYDIRFMVGLEQDILDSINEFYDFAPTQVETDETLIEERKERQELTDISDEEKGL